MGNEWGRVYLFVDSFFEPWEGVEILPGFFPLSLPLARSGVRGEGVGPLFGVPVALSGDVVIQTPLPFGGAPWSGFAH